MKAESGNIAWAETERELPFVFDVITTATLGNARFQVKITHEVYRDKGRAACIAKAEDKIRAAHENRRTVVVESRDFT